MKTGESRERGSVGENEREKAIEGLEEEFSWLQCKV
jgi:hypothetical protein